MSTALSVRNAAVRCSLPCQVCLGNIDKAITESHNRNKEKRDSKTNQGKLLIIIIIIMYIYYALINALSAHMIHINLNTIFYTHVEHLPKQFS